VNRILKIILIALAALLGLIVVTLAIVALTFDPNDYRDEVASLVKEKTGRELNIEGKIGLSVFPWIGAELGRATLSSAPGFGDAPFAAIESADIKVRLLPLLRGRVEARAIKLDGLRLNLAKNKAGAANWEGFGGAETEAPAEAPAEGGGAIASVAVGGLAITNAEISYRDDQSGAAYALRKLEVETGALAPGAPVDLKLRADLESAAPKISTPLSLDARVAFDADNMAATIAKGSLSALGLTLGVQDLKATQLNAAWRVAGALNVAPFNPREMMKALQVAYRPADANALTRMGLSAQLDASGDAIVLDGLSLQLDGTTIQGRLAMRDLNALRYQFDLKLDALNLDNYLPATAPAKAARGSLFVADAVAAEPSGAAPDLSALRTLRADGALGIAKLTAYGMSFTDFATTLKAADGMLDIAPRTKLYGGETRGTIRLDARAATPALGIKQSLQAVQIGPLLKDLKLTDKVSGTGALDLDLKARGLDPSAIRRSLGGTARFNLREGAIDGADFMKMVNQARELYDQYKGRPPEPRTEKTDRTVFQSLAGSFQIENGVAKTRDLNLQSSKLTATGVGFVDLTKDIYDMTLPVTPVRSEGKRTVTLPIVCRGSLSGGVPSCRPDLGAVAKGAAQEQLEEKKEEAKQKLEKKLNEGLERLFRR
jgi:AsmA protein